MINFTSAVTHGAAFLGGIYVATRDPELTTKILGWVEPIREYIHNITG